MKSIKHRLLSLLLTLVTVLSLLPTAAFAASNTGSGLKITTNQAYWSTRLLANGTPYSYRPPLVDGKLVYCMDSGLGYHYATPSYLNSFTWTSGTGADADAVLQSAVTNSGLSEMDAATVENVKWMMTYLNDCKASNVGQLFMAVQTYVWDHQSYKGEPGGDGDAGGYANADTYDLYLSLIDWLLEQKSQEDAEFQRQIEEYTAQGKSASIVEDDSAKWAVYAISSNRKNQSFFNYYGPRKLVTQDKPGGGGEEPAPPAGTGKITLKKTAGGTTTGLAGARFSIYFNGQIVGSDITNAQGEIYVENAATGLWSFVETAAPDGFCVDPTPKSVYVDVSEGDREYSVAATNYELPDMKIIKRDAMSGKPIAGTVFSIKSVTGSYSTSVTTGTDGSATLSAIPAGVYVVREESVPEPYIVTNTEQTVALRPGKTSEVTFVDYEKPGLEIIKKNIANGEPIEGVTYRIEQIDGNFSTSATTDNHGRIFLDSVPVGTFKVTEINVPSHVILCPIPQEVALKAGETSTVTFFNALKPNLEIRKVDSVTGDPVKGAKFQIWYGSNHTDTGELNDLGTYFSDASGKIILPEIKDGWYKVTELEPASGYAIKEPATQECFIAGGESKVLTFENTPLSAIIIRKVDSESGQPLEGAWFRIRYLGGTSGTGGTVVGEYKTSSNGTIVATGLKAGTYVCEEISAPDGYVITDATETVYLSGKDQDVITVTFGNDKMGSLLIVKKDAVTGAPISDVEFFIIDSDGSVIGNANGKYVTDSAGTIRIDGLTPGMTVIAREVRAKDGYILDDTPQSIKIKRNAVMTLEFRNQPKGGVLVKKVDAVTNAPISDAEFLVTDSDGNLIGNANGKFVTDSAGTFTLTDIAPGTTLVIKETRAKAGYILDDTPQTVKVKSNEVVTVEFRNQPKGNLIIVKQDSVTKEPLEGVEFKITYADGSYVDAEGGTLSSTGLYWTDKEGKITISGISGTIVATEVKSIPGYTIDENTRTQTVVVNPNDTQTLYFYNTPVGGLQIIKSDKDSGKRIAGVKFEIRKMNGEIIGTYTTDSDGVIYLPKAESGWYTVTELEAASGYLLDTTPHRIEVKDGQTATLEITNHKSSRILLHKVDKATGKGIYGAVFLLYDSNHNPIGEYVTDQDGYIYADEGLADGRYYLREIKAAPGYVLDPELKTIYVRYGSTTEIEWSNTAECGQIQIIKKSADDNATNGLPAGTLLEGAVFEIYDKAGNVVDTIKSDRNGRAVSKTLPLSRYTIREIKAPANYSINPTVMTAYLEFNGQIVTFEVQNTSVSTGASIKKTGPVQAVPGQPIRYVFSQIKNSSNVALDSFYWRDQLPAQVTLSKIVTGSYNQPLSYKVVYKTNLSGDYRTLADNLSTSKVYVLDARPAVLGLAANERVTEVMFVFGNVKAGFAQVETPYIYAAARSGLANNSGIVNVADVGGLYNGQWIQAVSRWLTTVYTKTTVKLPKTGY
ncbi:SpaA isopeptide-forming pilin-related protein [Dysosmobacter sp.]|uniref:SpaA isopeptide-forming pilin-related protein n=1 Tax=Dysosmobacter sp. TaxID=2591382 RepID=UPI003AB48F10